MGFARSILGDGAGRLRRGLGVFVAVLAGLVLAGCSSSPKIPELKPIASAAPLKVLWKASVGKSEMGMPLLATAAGSVFAASERGTVARLDVKTGNEVWRQNLRTRIQGGVGADSGLVLVGTPEGEVIALDADGKPKWRARVSSEVQGAPLVAGDVVVVRSADTRIFGLDAADGKRRWVFQRTGPPLMVRAEASAVAQRDFIFAGMPGGKLAALAAPTGNLRWESTVSTPRGATELERVSDVVGSPWLAEREVCAASFQGRTACFDTNTGTTLWTKDVSTNTGVTGDSRYVFVTDERSVVVALDRSTGSSMWRQDQLLNRRLSAPLVTGRFLVVGDIEGWVHVLSRDTGSLVGRVRADNSPIPHAPIAIPGGFVVQSQDGVVVAIAAPGG